MKLKVLIIEIGIKNIDSIKKYIIHKKSKIIYASSFLDVVDIIHLDKVHIIVFSDFRGTKSTIGYIKMFKTTNKDFNLIILSNNKKINENYQNYYIQRGVSFVNSCFDLDKINKSINECYLKTINDKSIKSDWSKCTKNAVRYLKNNYHISSKLLHKLSNSINYSMSSIVHQVKKETGFSVGEWVQKLRVNGALELLKSTNYPLKYISEQVGYKSVQGFIKAFKKNLGTTPSNFRKNIK